MRHDVRDGAPVLVDVRVVSEWPLAQHDGMFFSLVSERHGDDWPQAEQTMLRGIATSPLFAWVRPFVVRR